MIKVNINEKKYGFATTLKVIYELKNISGAKSMQEAIASIGNLDIDGQIDLLFAAYESAEQDSPKVCKQQFEEDILNEWGVFALSDTINKLVEGLLYSGLSPKEVEAKKLEMEKQAMTAGATSSVKVTG